MTTENARLAPIGAAPAQPPLTLVGVCETRLFSLSQDERLMRQIARLKTPILPDHVMVVRRDYLIEQSVLEGLAQRPGTGLMMRGDGDHAGECVALHVAAFDGPVAVEFLHRPAAQRTVPLPARAKPATAVELGQHYSQALRKRIDPFVLAVTQENKAALEKRLFGNAYKGATDFVTKFIWPPIALPATRLAAWLRLSPNMITFVSLLMVIATTYLFSQGQFAWGIVTAWLMTFLDTVDGKLARVTLTSSKWGNVFDHGIDLIHPPFWYIAWWWGLDRDYTQVSSGLLDLALAVIVVGYLVGRIQEGIFLALFKFEIHLWRKIDYVFRHVVARRNPNMFILMVTMLTSWIWTLFPVEQFPTDTAIPIHLYPTLPLYGADWGFVAVAAWTAFSCLFHSVQIMQAWWQRRRGPIQSWLVVS